MKGDPRNYELLCEQAIELLAEGNLDEVCVSSPSSHWTRRELINAIHSGSPEGKRFVNNLVKLALDLFLRGREKIEGFEVTERPKSH